MIRFWQTIVALWQILKWVRQQKKAIESNAQEYFNPQRAASFRLNLERLFYALEHGNGNLTMLPKWVRWLFSQTTVDNLVGEFGQRVLKSEKLKKEDEALKKPITVYPCH